MFYLPALSGCSCNPEPHGPTVVPDLSTTLRRRDDFLSLAFDFFNVVPNGDGTKLVRKGSGTAYMVVTHAPQHVLEEALDEGSPSVPSGPVRSRLSGPSRIAFVVPSDVDEIDYTPEALLEACAKWELSVSVNAVPPATPQFLLPLPSGIGTVKSPATGSAPASTAAATPLGRAVEAGRSTKGTDALSRSSGLGSATVAVDPNLVAIVAKLTPGVPLPPSATETSIELPFRLDVSPSQYGQFAHSPTAVASPSGRVELWHTRLGVRAGGALADESAESSSLRTMRALWTREPKFDPKNPCTYTSPTDPSIPFLAAMDSSDRIRIVHESSNFAPVECVDKAPGPKSSVQPEPVHVDRMMLTALGGYLDSKGDWGSSPLYGLESWKHRATLGRDHFVELVYSGILYPFGHRASLVKVTERKFHPLAPHRAFLWQRQFIVVREPVRAYPDALRHLPFTQVHVKTSSTPDLGPAPASSTESFVPMVNGRPFLFAIEGLDRSGNLVTLDIAVVWVPTANGKTATSDVDAARTLYTGDVARADLRGQRVAFATSSRPDDATYETASMSFAEPSAGPTPPSAIGFFPALGEAALQIEALRHLSGQNVGSPFKYAQAYLEHEFGADNAGELLMELASGATSIDFSKNSGKTGGFVAPSLDIAGLSRITGPVAGDLAKIASNTFDPTSFLSGLNAKLFGVFNLSDIIKSVLPADGGLLKAPQFVTQALNQVEELLQDLADLQAQAKRIGDQLTALGESVDAAITDVAAKASAIIDDIGNISLDEDKIDGDIDKIALTDLPAFATALTAVANLVTKDPLPPALQKLGNGPRLEFQKKLEQLTSVVATVAGTIHDVIKAFRTGQDLAKNLTVKLDWHPPIQGFPVSAPIFAPNRPDSLVLSVEVRAKDLPGKPAGVDMLAAIEDFEIRLIAPATFMILKFKRIAFSVKSGKKPDIDVVFDDLVFDGCLAFVQKLRELIPLAGFSDPPSLEVSTEGIKANFTLALPNVAVGVFNLSNLSFSAGFHIPFVGDPLSVSFEFCTRENPFVLTVMMLGGGGFFGIEVSPGGVLLLEASLEFGAALGVDFGVASGSVSIMAGIYFKMESSDASLSGYLRIRGEVDVLGLITASIEMYMELSYEFSSHKLVGRATIEIEVSVAFFSFSVSVSAERKFAGSNADPTFADAMHPELGWDPFAEYVGAFDFAA
ncbi:MAG TPA: hypothetical protein VF395_07915 [Polyangiaceae bacterium]